MSKSRLKFSKFLKNNVRYSFIFSATQRKLKDRRRTYGATNLVTSEF